MLSGQSDLLVAFYRPVVGSDLRLNHILYKIKLKHFLNNRESKKLSYQISAIVMI